MTEQKKVSSSDAKQTIDKLVTNLVSINDTSTEHHVVYSRDGRRHDTKSWSGWEWTHGIGLLGIWKYYEISGDDALLDEISKWFDNQFSTDVVEKNINTMAVFTTLINLYEKTQKTSYLPYIEKWCDWAYRGCPRTKFGGLQHITYNSVNSEQMWDDTLMMTVLPLAKAGFYLNKPEYVDEAKYQFMLHVQYLFDSESGLFYHGFCFDGNHHFGKTKWARGNSWVTMFIPDFLELLNLQPTDSFYRFAVNVLVAQIDALQKFQDPLTGLFRTVLNGPQNTENYLEASATAGFSYGILKAVRKGYIAEKYLDFGLAAVKGAFDCIDKDGELLRTSAGTPVGDSDEFYYTILQDKMPYGQAMAICALVEYLQTFL